MQLTKKLFHAYFVLLASWIGFSAIKDKIEFGYTLYAPSLPAEMSRIQEVDSITFFKPGYKPARQSYDEYVGGFWRYTDEHNLGETGYVGSSKCNKDKCQASRILVALFERGLLTSTEDENWLTSPELREFHNQIKDLDLIESHNISLEVLQNSAGIAVEAKGVRDDYIFLAYYGRSHGTAKGGSRLFKYEKSPYYEILLKRNEAENSFIPIKFSSFFHGGKHAFSFLNLFLAAFFLAMALVWIFIIIKLLLQYKRAVTDVYRHSRQQTELQHLSDDFEEE